MKDRIAGPRALAAGVAGLAVLIVADEAMAKTYNLSISGDPGARYSGTCTVTLAGGTATIDLDGAVPQEEQFAGEGLSCQFQAQGRVVAEIAHDGSRSRSESSGGTVRVSAR